MSPLFILPFLFAPLEEKPRRLLYLSVCTRHSDLFSWKALLAALHQGNEGPNRNDEQHTRARAREVSHVVYACDAAPSCHLRLL